ncbi:MAG: carboxypeptidase-like regulatory domain-containing protein [Bacteroidales bacterium]|nr:carboxypeptidase-like regulatory domain-containing protein [Bacteroidales bacterium]
MKTLSSKYIIFQSIVSMLLLITPKLQAQKIIHVSGRVIDNKTKQPLPFANVILVGKDQGTITNYKGYYEFIVNEGDGKIEAQSVGYKNQVKLISQEKNQVINFALSSQSLNLNQVVIKGKALRYRNKNNPAVALIRKVINNKDLNRKGNLDFYQFNKYNKIEFELNEADEKVLKNNVFKKFRFVFNYADTSKLDGETYLPVFFKETSSKVYYRKNPRVQKEFVTGIKTSGFPPFIDKRGFDMTVNRLFKNIDIYDNNIFLLTNQFVSPISVIAPNVYKFHIIDTLNVDGYNCINLGFEPRNKADFAFSGHLYITNDNRYAVVKAVMGVPKGINLNFVRGLHFVQEFKYIDNKIWMRSRDQMIINFNITKNGFGMLGKKTNYYDDYVLNQKQNDSVYSGIEKKVIMPDASSHTEQFWAKNRIEPLKKHERNIYVMSDSIQKMPAYKTSVNLAMLVDEGYWNFGKIDIGPVNSFYGFNSVEGNVPRIAGMTSPQFSKYFRLTGNVAYGFKDKKYKYGLTALWSLNKISLNARPTQTLSVTYQNETEFPGMEMQLVSQNNFFLSFKRGVADKILYYKLFDVDYYRKWEDGFSTTFSIRHQVEYPGGNWQFNAQGYPLSQLTYSEASVKMRFAPNEKYYQGMDYRTPIVTRYPVIQLDYTQGFKNVFNSDFTYSKLSLSVFKRFYFGLFGYLDSDVEAGKVFGNNIPYPLLYLHRANQSYSYQPYSYNMMNFLEFVSDRYAAYFGEYHFNGFLFNQIPLIKYLKLRAVVSFKALYGGLGNGNNPDVTPGLMPFPTDTNGNPTTFTLGNSPYMEASVGIENIFQLFRVDLVKRLSYLNNPHVSQYGVRISFKVDF